MTTSFSHPYLKDQTVSTIWALYNAYLTDAQTELERGQEIIAHATAALQAYQQSGRLQTVQQIIENLPKTPCSFCGGMVIDRAPLVDALADFREYQFLYNFADMLNGGDSSSTVFWFGFSQSTGKREPEFGQACIQCHAKVVDGAQFDKRANRIWTRREGALDKSFAARIFEHFPSVVTVGLSRIPLGWYLITDDENIWYFEGTKEEISDSLGISI